MWSAEASCTAASLAAFFEMYSTGVVYLRASRFTLGEGTKVRQQSNLEAGVTSAESA